MQRTTYFLITLYTLTSFITIDRVDKCYLSFNLILFRWLLGNNSPNYVSFDLGSDHVSSNLQDWSQQGLLALQLFSFVGLLGNNDTHYSKTQSSEQSN